ncbi:PDZ and LIM domain protein 2 isoform X4 [Zonotrichia albicollis]|uniref:PDZ and LIM domain protein 2 isoform X4 n=1 Tax=Zonotrichia albicollis TaxID=44394 RepID=UPI003D80CFAB
MREQHRDTGGADPGRPLPPSLLLHLRRLRAQPQDARPLLGGGRAVLRETRAAALPGTPGGARVPLGVPPLLSPASGVTPMSPGLSHRTGLRDGWDLGGRDATAHLHPLVGVCEELGKRGINARSPTRITQLRLGAKGLRGQGAAPHPRPAPGLSRPPALPHKAAEEQPRCSVPRSRCSRPGPIPRTSRGCCAAAEPSRCSRSVLTPVSRSPPTRLAGLGGSLGVSSLHGSCWILRDLCLERCLCWRGSLGSVEPQFVLSVLEKDLGVPRTPQFALKGVPGALVFIPLPAGRGSVYRLCWEFRFSLLIFGLVSPNAARGSPKPRAHLRVCRDTAASGRYQGLSWSCQRGGHPRRS